jgi:murein DD-endopeptidase MepM/ murein hydrolase activator NlpD
MLKTKACSLKPEAKSVILYIICLFIIAGCATVPSVVPSKPAAEAKGGFYHRVEKGQTLWSIARTYNIALEELLNANQIQGPSRIEVGRLLLIPGKLDRTVSPIAYAEEDFKWPLKGRVIAAFGQSANNVVNKGINIQPDKNSNVAASRSGKVVFYNDDFLNLGKTVIIEHPDGFWTVYARNKEVFVKVGDLVPRSAIIGKVGQAGRDKNTYLHFEIRKGHIPQNPSFYLP